MVCTRSHNFWIFSNFFVLCQMSKYFGKCFGPSTRAPKFLTQIPSFLLLKFASQLKLIQSVVRVGILVICVTSQVFRILLSGFWVSGSQFPSPTDPFPGFWVSDSPVAWSKSPRVSDPRVPDLRVTGSPVSESPVSGSKNLRSQG